MEVVIVKAAIDKLSGIIVQIACKEIAPVCNFKKDFEWLMRKFTIIRDYLLSAPAAQDERYIRLLDHLRDVAWDAEDIVEECAVRPLYTKSVTQSCVCSPDEFLFHYRMAKRIQKVKEKVGNIIIDGEHQKLFLDLVPAGSEQPSSSAVWGAARNGNSFLPNDSHPVAIEPKLQHLISMIDESTVPVIAVVGMGGTGKTFLVRNAFDRIQQRYEHKIWLSISQYSVKQLQLDLVWQFEQPMKRLRRKVEVREGGQLMGMVKELSEECAAKLIHEVLQETKSLIVLDDVWAREKNIIQSLGLPIGEDRQCKVVVTTRDLEICQNIGAFPYKMELLSEEDSWQLFCAHAFGGNPPQDHLQVIASQVEKQCARLPLALKTIGASLSGCTEIKRWRSFLAQLMKVDLKKDSFMQILKLSYDSLRPALKLYFSYFSFFHEDELIDQEYLINLWIAEGFVPQSDHQWEDACSDFDQLANLCLVEVEKDEYLVKFCKIHDLLLDLAIAISERNRCTFAISKDGRSTFAVDDAITSPKRILLGRKEIDDMAIAQSRASCPRSLRTLSLYENPIQSIDEKFVDSIRLLRVLDLSKTNISTLPHCIGKLKLLKLLNLSSTEIIEVPICVRSLKSLLFLDLSECKQLQSLPEWISELKCLQHLNIIDCNNKRLSHMPKGISVLVALRVLRSKHLRLSVEEDGLLKLEDVVKLTRLQELSLKVQHETQLNSLEEGILAQLLKIRHLSITSTSTRVSSLPQSMSALHYLHTLKLKNFAVPNWVCNCELADLAHLKLVKCECSHYPELQAMPNLQKLTLDGNRSCKELPKAFGEPSGFPKLRFLDIQNFSILEALPDLKDGAMAILEDFYVGFCPRVNNVPEGLKGLRKLKKFYYTGDETDGLNKGPEFWNDIKAKCPNVGIIQTFM